ncbi:RPAP1-like domain containing protein,putative [Babesia bigemina]|uniref:RPAP1-like domain containing protein,putative n=1 Tax=Babesia bigemina TaxID=5866 RepID=A0A061D8A4_BABBI|nr:RPAP1-like domain containing protein,putative [Babesia bigemina]CDR95149.1 RPAP1-like domain containing protein,putative [Babesia bigemina]|eukprot:XP_012767335.1 RPAP1-like domain containing protein,putative [Babesia bigemina]
MKGWEYDPEVRGADSDNDFDIIEHFSDDEDAKPSQAAPPTKPSTAQARSTWFPKATHRRLLGYSLSRSQFTQAEPQAARAGSSHGDIRAPTDKPRQNDHIQGHIDEINRAYGAMGSAHDAALPDIASMTEEEIKAEQQFLYEKLGKDMCDFLIQRRLRKMRERNGSTESAGGEGTACSPPHAISPVVSGGKGSTYEPPKALSTVSFKVDAEELRKLEWTNPVEPDVSGGPIDAGNVRLHQLRFDFEGHLLSASGRKDGERHRHESSLYNHGKNPDQPGYTIPELLELMQSTFKPQVQIATHTLCNIVRNAHVSSPPYFGFPRERWLRYVTHDANMVGRMGYAVMEHMGTYEVLGSAMRCLAIMLYGDMDPESFGTQQASPTADSSVVRSNTIWPMQELLAGLHIRDMGVALHRWNPFVATFEGASSAYAMYERAKSAGGNRATAGSSANNTSTSGPEDTDTMRSRLSETTDEAESRHGGGKGAAVKSVRFADQADDTPMGEETRDSRMIGFYLDALNGEFISLEIEDIKHRLAVATGIEETDYYTQSNMDDTVYLIVRGVIGRLCNVVSQHEVSLALKSRFITFVCGLLMRLGEPFAQALVKCEAFCDLLESFTASLIVGTEQHKKLSEVIGESGADAELRNDRIHLTSAVLCCMRLLSVFDDRAFATLLDRIGAIALVKQTLTFTYGSQLSQLFNAAANTPPSVKPFSTKLVMPAVMAVRCLTVWALQNEYNDTLDEIVPVIELEVSTLCRLIQMDGSTLNSFISANGVLLMHIFIHMATLLEGEAGKHVNFIWDVGRVHDLLVALCEMGEEKSSIDARLLIASLFQLQSVYMRHCKRNGSGMKLENVTRSTVVIKSIERYATAISEQFCQQLVKNDVFNLGYRWWSTQIMAGNEQPIVVAREGNKDVDSYVVPVHIANCMLEALEVLQTEDETLYNSVRANIEPKFKLMMNIIVERIALMHKDRTSGTVTFPGDEGIIVQKPIPMLESWSGFILRVVRVIGGYSDQTRGGSAEHVSPTSVTSENNDDANGDKDKSSTWAAGLFAALTISGCYETIADIWSTLSSVCGPNNDVSIGLGEQCKHVGESNAISGDGADVVTAFREFNEMVANANTLGDSSMPIMTFIAFVPTFFISAIAGGTGAAANDTQILLLEALNKRGRFREEFLKWVPPFDVANSLIKAVVSADKNANWNVDRRLLEALEVLVFGRLSILDEETSLSGTRAASDVTELHDTIDSIVARMVSMNVRNHNKHLLMASEGSTGSTPAATEHDELSRATVNVINRFNSGSGDSPYVMAVIMLLISAFSRLDSAKRIWADTDLMVLLGRNLVVDRHTLEIICMHPDGHLSLGNAMVYLPNFNGSEEILRSQRRLLQEFGPSDLESNNAIMLIAMASLRKYDRLQK